MILAEVLEWDGTDTLYELIDGQVVAMPRTSDARGTMIANFALAIGPQLQPPCRIVGNAGITRPERADSYYIADLAVTCDQPADQRFFLPQPRLIVEVLSRSTAAHDRGRKGEEYRHISSVEAILFVFSDERRAELWRREGELGDRGSHRRSGRAPGKPRHRPAAVVDLRQHRLRLTADPAPTPSPERLLFDLLGNRCFQRTRHKGVQAQAGT